MKGSQSSFSNSKSASFFAEFTVILHFYIFISKRKRNRSR